MNDSNFDLNDTDIKKFFNKDKANESLKNVKNDINKTTIWICGIIASVAVILSCFGLTMAFSDIVFMSLIVLLVIVLGILFLAIKKLFFLQYKKEAVERFLTKL